MKLNKHLSFCILLITISSVNQWTSLPIGNTVFWWIINIYILFSFYRSRDIFYDRYNDVNIKILLLYLGWNVICIVRGMGVAENYWEWKFLIETGMVLLLPLTIYISTDQLVLRNILRTWTKYALPAFFILFPFFTAGDALGRYLVPISFFLLLFPLLAPKWKVIALMFSLGVVLAALDARSNVIKFTVSLLFGCLFYFKGFLSINVLKIARLFFLLVPYLLFFLAFSGQFNVFKIGEYLNRDYSTTVVKDGQMQEEDLTADTRTLLYEEVFASAQKYNYFLAGRTPARGNESELFGYFLAEELQTGKMERFSNEVSILNIFTWTGIIGVVLYFLVFYQASYLAIYKSNNFFIKIIGLFVAFRWSYAWIEDFSQFDLSYFFLWVMIGMCFSAEFRKMDNNEMLLWVHRIFSRQSEKKAGLVLKA